MEQFVKDVLNEGKFEECWYHRYFDRYYVVFAWDEKDLYCKVAYNCDDLQCDYDWDWLMPTYPVSGDVVDTELICTRCSVEEILEHLEWARKEISTI